ncbi:MAG TPA: LacI family DNA-binding transcriptional regulator [Streptosporangiaceae bacterium]
MSSRRTMRDVAQVAGVSVMTVSRVINGQPGVLPETAARVEHAIRRLGYQRNDAARQLRRRGQPTQIIGLLVDDLANPFFAALTRAVEDAARQRHYVVLIGSSNDSLDREREVVAAFFARQVDGLILVPVAGSHKFLASQMAQGTKVVCVDRPVDGLDVDRVLVDNRRAAGDAVRHLLELGHRRIAFLGDREDIWTISERYVGFCAALAGQGLEPDPQLVRRGLRSRGEAAAAVAGLMSLPQPPTALFTSNDLTTMGAIDSGHGKSAALVGFDDFALADKLTPPVSVVTQDPAAMGGAAAELLFSRIAGDTSPPRELILSTRMVARGSGEVPAAVLPAGHRTAPAG